jgi:hypothetical protein
MHSAVDARKAPRGVYSARCGGEAGQRVKPAACAQRVGLLHSNALELLDERRGRCGPLKLHRGVAFIRAETDGSGVEIAERAADRFGLRLHRRPYNRRPQVRQLGRVWTARSKQGCQSPQPGAPQPRVR